MSISLNLLVLKCNNIVESRVFYEKLGVKFKREKHGNGIEHLAAEMGSLIFELYPLRDNEKPDNCRLGFSTKLLADLSDDLVHDENIPIVKPLTESNGRLVLVVKDPDGRTIEISQKLY